ncbi:hypothetical protein C8Q80DRAFT_1124133 [Daedaleopsis nitida]|nr:hypothetical protein C8Q80DRAFT_1124133 [Daedaleopsis nitida]
MEGSAGGKSWSGHGWAPRELNSGLPLPIPSVSVTRSSVAATPRTPSVPPMQSAADPASDVLSNTPLSPSSNSPIPAPMNDSTAPSTVTPVPSDSTPLMTPTAATSGETTVSSALIDDGAPPHGQKRPLEDNFINAVAANGSFMAPKRARKTRKDKGQKMPSKDKHGSRADIENDAAST